MSYGVLNRDVWYTIIYRIDYGKLHALRLLNRSLKRMIDSTLLERRKRGLVNLTNLIRLRRIDLVANVSIFFSMGTTFSDGKRIPRDNVRRSYGSVFHWYV